MTNFVPGQLYRTIRRPGAYDEDNVSSMWRLPRPHNGGWGQVYFEIPAGTVVMYLHRGDDADGTVSPSYVVVLHETFRCLIDEEDLEDV